MDIRDIGKIPVSFKIDQVNPRKKLTEPDRKRMEEPAQKYRADKLQDEYISSMVKRVQIVSYNIYDVRHGKIDDLRARIQEGSYNPNGEKIAQKLIDLALSTGRKNLRVYRMET